MSFAAVLAAHVFEHRAYFASATSRAAGRLALLGSVHLFAGTDGRSVPTSSQSTAGEQASDNRIWSSLSNTPIVCRKSGNFGGGDNTCAGCSTHTASHE